MEVMLITGMVVDGLIYILLIYNFMLNYLIYNSHQEEVELSVIAEKRRE
jgi:hypothetical protein